MPAHPRIKAAPTATLSFAVSEFLPAQPVAADRLYSGTEAMAREAYGKIGHFFDPTYEQFERQAWRSLASTTVRFRRGRRAACRASFSRPAATTGLRPNP